MVMKLKLDIEKMKYETYYNLLDEFRTELKERGENPLDYHYDNWKIECTITKTK